MQPGEMYGQNSSPGKKILPVIRWTSSQGAIAYDVRIKDESGRLALLKRTRASALRTDLKPGKYSVQVAALNKFHKRTAWSPPVSIRVRRTAVPSIKTMDPDLILPGKMAKITIKGRNFLRESQVFLKGRGRLYAGIKMNGSGPGEIRFLIGESKIPPGSYSIVVRNPGPVREARYGGMAVSASPVLISVTPSLLTDRRVYTVIIKGKNFFKGRQGTRLKILTPGGVLPLLQYRVQDDASIRFRVDTRKARQGSYELSLENPGELLLQEFGALTFTLDPILLSLRPKNFTLAAPPRKIILEGRNFSSDTTVKLRGDREFTVKTQYVNSRRLVVHLEKIPWTKGPYDFIITNPGGKTQESIGILEVK